MNPEELVVSDVHVDCGNWRRVEKVASFEGDAAVIAVTRFRFVLPEAFEMTSNAATPAVATARTQFFDEDGDLVVCRRNAPERAEVFEIEHGIASTLKDVGLQVWAGSLIMCDFILAHPKHFRGRTCVELGAGAGLTSLTLSMLAEHIICTDGNMKALSNCLKNVKRNAGYTGEIRVRQLDWRTEFLPFGPGEFEWSELDAQLFTRADVVVAADVFYDDEATAAFFETVLRLFRGSRRMNLFVSLEKRYNFTIEERSVTAPAYVKFQQCLSDLLMSSDLVVEARMLSTIFPQYFQYERTSHLEVWQISSECRT